MFFLVLKKYIGSSPLFLRVKLTLILHLSWFRCVLLLQHSSTAKSDCEICVLFFNYLQALNLILLTSTELGELRSLLKKSLVDSCGKDLFQSLYASWRHSPMATISLCLLAQVMIDLQVVLLTRTPFDLWMCFLMCEGIQSRKLCYSVSGRRRHKC